MHVYLIIFDVVVMIGFKIILLFHFRTKPAGKTIGGFVLLAATLGISASAVDDILVFQQCSK